MKYNSDPLIRRWSSRVFDAFGNQSELVNSIGNVLGWKFSKHGLLPLDTTTLIHSSNSSTRDVSVVHGHRDLMNTLCPGKYF